MLYASYFIVSHQITGHDPYEHYLLYHLATGNAYHCELCPIPQPETDSNLPDILDHNTSLSIGLGVIVGLVVILAIFAAVVLWVYWVEFAKHGSFYCAIIVCGVCTPNRNVSAYNVLIIS